MAASIVLMMLAGCQPEFLQSAADIRSAAVQSMQEHNFGDASRHARRLTEKTPEDPEAHRLLAQVQAQAGKLDAALTSLEQAIKLGLKNPQEIMRDSQLAPLRALPGYAELMARSFPAEAPVATPGVSISITSETPTTVAPVSIQELPDGRQVIQAGDVRIETSPPGK